MFIIFVVLFWILWTCWKCLMKQKLFQSSQEFLEFQLNLLPLSVSFDWTGVLSFCFFFFPLFWCISKQTRAEISQPTHTDSRGLCTFLNGFHVCPAYSGLILYFYTHYIKGRNSVYVWRSRIIFSQNLQLSKNTEWWQFRHWFSFSALDKLLLRDGFLNAAANDGWRSFKRAWIPSSHFLLVGVRSLDLLKSCFFPCCFTPSFSTGVCW